MIALGREARGNSQRLGGFMSKLIPIFGAALPALPDVGKTRKRNSHGFTTDDYRRLLSELQLRPPSQRAFLRKLLNRALVNGAHTEFPVASRVVPDPAGPS
jgi:hypothetical protein